MQLSFVLEYNLTSIQNLLRSNNCSAFITYDKEIGISMNSQDPEIIAKLAEQKTNLGVDRILITRDAKFITHIKSAPIKVIVLIDKKYNLNLSIIKQKELCKEIIKTGLEMVSKTKGAMVAFIECSKFY